MRVRKKRNAPERLERCKEYMIYEKPYRYEGTLTLEIGCGKGAFILETARRHPDINYVAMEKISDVILLAAEKIKNNEIKNVRLLNTDAGELLDYFSESSIDRIYLNFSDPWPRLRHAKRRLTAPKFLEIYKKLLTPNGCIFLKTDNRILFDYSLETLHNAGFKLENITYDLHNSEHEKDNIHTEYEDNFSAKGFSINRLEAYK